jgi:predicted nucleic acid-binding protein
LIYLDSNVVIRLVEGDALARAPLVARLSSSLGVAGSLTTSRLSRLECRSNLLRAGDTEVTAAVVELATEICAKYNLKTPDARHYASAMEAGAKVFLTGDRVLARCSDVAVEIL